MEKEIQFGDSELEYMANNLSNHSPLMIKFHDEFILKTQPFKFHEMWIADEKFSPILVDVLKQQTQGTSMYKNLKGLNKEKFRNMHYESDIAKLELNATFGSYKPKLQDQEQSLRKKYNDTLSVSLSLKKQRSKLDWIAMGDQCTKFFFARVQQTRTMNQIYRIRDEEGSSDEGRDKVASVLVKYYKKNAWKSNQGLELKETVCKPKKNGGLGLKDISTWNTTLVTRHLGDVAMKKDDLWVKWVHEQYLRECNWWTIILQETCWFWKKFYKVK
ncbi:hypothetical protein Cgig2_024155 [Carnegiea gigantea]|uniref:Uncharacterized protein n=1 Tax=Carnegiea gigantea TaxID=171969 RepID=A0A9Q1KA29_9CARY|nr:hypothetical protein Cgig2_024155 [Carnegiea gigantea]